MWNAFTQRPVNLISRNLRAPFTYVISTSYQSSPPANVLVLELFTFEDPPLPFPLPRELLSKSHNTQTFLRCEILYDCTHNMDKYSHQVRRRESIPYWRYSSSILLCVYESLYPGLTCGVLFICYCVHYECVPLFGTRLGSTYSWCESITCRGLSVPSPASTFRDAPYVHILRDSYLSLHDNRTT